MANYYSILGITKEANELEIKTAFRKLAKLYHPDKNPNNPDAKLLFENILKAYNTLINPNSRRRYDTITFNKPPITHINKGNNYNARRERVFSDQELSERQYYQRYYKTKQQHEIKTKVTTTYSDYKYILFATPLAVGLLMLIISFFTEPPTLPVNTNLKKEEVKSVISLLNGATPYSGYFGGIRTFNTPYDLKINNSSNYDAVITVFDKQTNMYLQHSYVHANYTIEFSKLPESGVYWKCMLGKNWNPDKILFNNKISGSFDSIVQYQNWKKSPTIFSQNKSWEKSLTVDSRNVNHGLNLLYVIHPPSKNECYISNDIEFFEK